MKGSFGRERKSSPIIGCTTLSCDELQGARAASDSHLEYEVPVKCDDGCECWGNGRQFAAMTRASPIGLWRRNFPSKQKFAAAAVAAACPALPGDGAGDGNRTHVSSLGSCSSTIELHPHPLNCRRCAVGEAICPGPGKYTNSGFSRWPGLRGAPALPPGSLRDDRTASTPVTPRGRADSAGAARGESLPSWPHRVWPRRRDDQLGKFAGCGTRAGSLGLQSRQAPTGCRSKRPVGHGGLCLHRGLDGSRQGCFARSDFGMVAWTVADRRQWGHGP